MLNIFTDFSLLLFSFFSITTNANEQIIESGLRNIALRDGKTQKIYKNIIGEHYGLQRSLTKINNVPALYVTARREIFYYTLIIRNGKIFIDCAYMDAREKYNLARVALGTCGTNIPLTDEYAENTPGYLTGKMLSIFSFDTRQVFDLDRGADFFLGKIGEVEIFDRYSSASAVINSSPEKIIKSSNGCFNFESSTGYLIFLNTQTPTLKYLDILRSEPPMRLQRLGEKELKALAVNKCIAVEDSAS